MNNTHHFRQLARAKNWKEFEQFANNMNIYSLNVTYADTSGNIGYYMTGRVPKRTKQAQESANYPVNGWDGSCDYSSYIEPKELPHTLNPKQGYIISANHKIHGPNYKHYIGKCFKYGMRASRIDQMIQQAIKVCRCVSFFDTVGERICNIRRLYKNHT